MALDSACNDGHHIFMIRHVLNLLLIFQVWKRLVIRHCLKFGFIASTQVGIWGWFLAGIPLSLWADSAPPLLSASQVLPRAIQSAQGELWGEARFYAEWAMRLNPWDKNVRQTWDYLQQQPQLKSFFQLSSSITYLYDYFLIQVPLWIIAGFWCFLFMVFTIRLTQWQVRRYLSQKYQIPMVLPVRALFIVLLMLVAIGFLGATKLYFEFSTFGVVTQAQPIFLKPELDSGDLFLIQAGERVQVIKQDSDFLLVKAEGFRTGWLPKARILIFPDWDKLFL